MIIDNQYLLVIVINDIGKAYVSRRLIHYSFLFYDWIMAQQHHVLVSWSWHTYKIVIGISFCEYLINIIALLAIGICFLQADYIRITFYDIIDNGIMGLGVEIPQREHVNVIGQHFNRPYRNFLLYIKWYVFANGYIANE